jgi:hypothetical protein
MENNLQVLFAGRVGQRRFDCACGSAHYRPRSVAEWERETAS